MNIAINYGFYSQEYYCEVFHKIMGVSPSTYYKFVNYNENETKDLFEKYNTYFTIILILSYLDKKSLFQLMPLKKRFYEKQTKKKSILLNIIL